ncbi:remorin-like [Cynara cardunculus var. scolymus]|uniref:Remorin, C-terminal n=1 Tax=Cynara cardunculus var. scolymus TaxID=59895 RepID=A0A103YJ90_CYNCS|nr:remorin-like [Cynara cardunculus var. scolymus]KVI10131.1 Remorin, C-terminal [Cynara cardunculus var. scolymus]
MAVEEAKKVEVEPECQPEPPVAAAEKEEEKALVPVEPLVSEEKPTDDTKALIVVEKPEEVCDEKPKEGSINRDDVLAKVATEKKDALIKAWEESEKSKAENKAQQKLSSIEAWEISKKAELEAELKKIEEDLEKKKAKYIEKMKNKMAILHKRAQEKRAITEAKCGEELLKAEELAAKCRATGDTPKKLLGWF